MKGFTKIAALFLCVLFLAACGGKKSIDSVPMLSDTMLDIKMGTTADVEVLNYMGEITWTSSDTRIASVSENGDITPVSIGTAAIAATLENGERLNCVVNVAPGESSVERIDVVSIYTGISDITANYNDSPTVWLEAQCSPVDPLEPVTWSSSDESLATVTSDGTVLVCGNGTVTITATAINGVNGSCKIRIKNVPEDVERAAKEKVMNVPVVEITKGQSSLTEAVPVHSPSAKSGVIISEQRMYLSVGEYQPLTYAVSNGNEKKVTWKTTDKSVCVVKDAIIVGVGEGRCVVSAVTEDGAVASCEVAVGKKAIKELKAEASEK